MKALVFAFWLALGIAAVMALVPHPPLIPGQPSDKLQHIIAFATLAALSRMAFPQTSALRIGLWLCAFGGVIELVQAIPVLSRDADIRDWIADAASVATVLALIQVSRVPLPGRSG